jgi:hypothetical protein
MKNNVHPYERGARVVIGISLMSLAFWGPTNLWFLVGIIPVATGLSGWCPFYSMLGINTCKMKSSPSIQYKS